MSGLIDGFIPSPDIAERHTTLVAAPADLVFQVASEIELPFAEPGLVKIAWTLEADPIDDTHTRLASETRAVATDDQARRRFKRYWRLAGFGIVLIRWLALPAVRREAERRRWRMN